MRKQCPQCGATSDSVGFIGSFCEACYISMNTPALPREIVAYVCRECGAERVKQWGEDIALAISHQLKDKVFGVPKASIKGGAVSIKYGGLPRVFTIRLKRKDSLCDACSQKFSGYYEGIIQLRGRYGRDPQFVDALLKKLEKATFVQKVVELKEGIDIYYGDRAIARSILSAMKLKPKVSNKLYGVKDGQRVYRTTFLVRD
ncbi:MAG: 60S ribosomal export protein NMD3 [Candidatus Micrarchaeota archaeon]|nr:60S ribosomal export protein NMD3 [Candidatus Micrarchaeota archaeon]